MTSPTWVSWLITCDCQPSDADAISALATEMTDYVSANEPATTHFEWSTTNDKTCVYLHERYSDSAQAMAHIAAFGEQFGSRFMNLLKPSTVVVFGHPNDDLRQKLEGLSPRFTESFAGFQR